MRIALFTLFILGLTAVRAEARPVYAIETGKPCAYCHINPKGGGARNPRGFYFAANKHSFRGYDELKIMGRFSVPLGSASVLVFKLVSKEGAESQWVRRLGR